MDMSSLDSLLRRLEASRKRQAEVLAATEREIASVTDLKDRQLDLVRAAKKA